MDNMDRAVAAQSDPSIRRDTTTLAGLIREIDLRRKHGGWYTLICITEGKDIRIKGYGTWLQVYQVDGIDYSGCMDISVTQFRDQLRLPFVTIGGRTISKEQNNDTV